MHLCTTCQCIPLGGSWLQPVVCAKVTAPAFLHPFSMHSYLGEPALLHCGRGRGGGGAGAELRTSTPQLRATQQPLLHFKQQQPQVTPMPPQITPMPPPHPHAGHRGGQAHGSEGRGCGESEARDEPPQRTSGWVPRSTKPMLGTRQLTIHRRGASARLGWLAGVACLGQGHVPPLGLVLFLMFHVGGLNEVGLEVQI